VTRIPDPKSESAKPGGVRVPDAALPEVAEAPPPWDLHGEGCIILLRQTAASPTLPTATDAEFAGGPAIVMFVDYAESPVGPYRELLYIPGRFLFGGTRAWSIGRIFVSTWESVVNGRRNWGIPKDRADFERQAQGAGRERIQLRVDGRLLASLDISRKGPTLPFPGWLLGSGMRTLTQDYAGRRYTLAPTASGKARYARVHELSLSGADFGALDASNVIAATWIPAFRMRFPEARISALAGPGGSEG
jgi:hypothetical protein